MSTVFLDLGTIKHLPSFVNEGEEWKDAPEERDWKIFGPYYETMVFCNKNVDCPFDQAQERHQTEREAMEYHQEMVGNIKAWIG